MAIILISNNLAKDPLYDKVHILNFLRFTFKDLDMGKLFNKLKNLFKQKPFEIPNAIYGTLKTTGSGFTLIQKDKATLSVDWDQVKQIATYKWDCYIYDLICLEFKLIEQEYLNIHEHMIGFWETAKSMELAFPDIPDNWADKVMLPPFEHNYSVLFPKNVNKKERQDNTEDSRGDIPSKP